MLKKVKKEVLVTTSKNKKKTSKKSDKQKKILRKKRDLKDRKKDFVRALIVLLVLIIIYFISIFIFQLRSVYSEQIIMETKPQHISLNMRQGEEKNISIETEIRTSFFCQVSCNYTFKDVSSGELLYEGSFGLANYKNHLFETTLSTNRLGVGQEIYLFEVSCKTRDSRTCSSTELPVIRTSLITLNYDLSEEQQSLKDNFLNIINEVSDLLFKGQTNLLSAEATINNLSEMKINHLEIDLYGLIFFESVLNKDIEIIRELWETQNYSFILEELSKRNVLEKAKYFEELSAELVELIKSEKEIHNSAVLLLKSLEEDIPALEDLKRASLLAKLVEPEPTINELYNNTLLLKNFLVNQNFTYYKELEPLIKEIHNLTNYLFDYYERKLFDKENLFYEVNIWMSLLNNDLCLVREENCNEIISLPTNNFSDISQITNYSSDVCSDVEELENLKQNILEQQKEIRQELSQEELISIDKEKFLVSSSMIHWQIQNLPVNEFFAKSILRNYSFSIMNGSFQDPNYYPEEYDESKSRSFLPGDYLENDSDYFFDACTIEEFEFVETGISFETGDFILVLGPRMPSWEEVPATCCFKSECKNCCDSFSCKEDLRNPLIVLHGYSFYSFNSAFHSTNTFNDFVSFAFDQELYYPAGIIGPSFYPDYEKYDLTRTFIPPVFKATYYDVLRFEEIRPGEINIKSQSIEDYGDRLNDLIIFVNNVTGKREVDIVAHSMGGLVTRSYIDKYGDESLGKIILIGTPNKGVPRRLLHLCKFFGGQTECEEMYEDSAFMNYLNYEATLPNKEVHMIIGKGCSTFGGDGDGVVQKRSAELDFANNHYFTGSCDLIDNFHRDMNKPSKYPEIYDLIISILLS